eukprot:14542615-Ditylum_brightwellii.AAC.1
MFGFSQTSHDAMGQDMTPVTCDITGWSSASYSMAWIWDQVVVKCYVNDLHCTRVDYDDCPVLIVTYGIDLGPGDGPVLGQACGIEVDLGHGSM